MKDKDKISKVFSTGVPEPSIRRMPTYLNFARTKLKEGVEHISSRAIAQALSLDSTQVTKDLAYTKIVGKTRVGYNTKDLIKELEDFLGFNKTDVAFLVGAGNLGMALLSYIGFNNSGLKIIAAFDTNSEIINEEVNGVKILHYNKFTNLTKRMHVNIGIITTPANVAQNVANDMIESGIKAIWNFSPCNIKVPDDVVIENTSIYTNLALLFNKMKSL